MFAFVQSPRQIDAEELFPYLLELGYSNDEAQQILEEADKDKSGTIDFEEFIQGLEVWKGDRLRI